jgi:hypothetical protein
MPEWHCEPGVSIAGMTALPKSINLSLHQLNEGAVYRNGGSACSGMGGQNSPESTLDCSPGFYHPQPWH